MIQEPTIAIVDDDEGVRLSTASLVRSLGYLVRTYASGSDFLGDERVHEPSVMISDLRMPGMNGDELQARLLADGRRFPIIFLTAYATDIVKQRVLDAGAICLLSKPADGETFIRCIEEALEVSRTLHRERDIAAMGPPEVAPAGMGPTFPSK